MKIAKDKSIMYIDLSRVNLSTSKSNLDQSRPSYLFSILAKVLPAKAKAT